MYLLLSYEKKRACPLAYLRELTEMKMLRIVNVTLAVLLMLDAVAWAQFTGQQRQATVCRMDFSRSSINDWQVPEGVSVSVNPTGGLHGTGSLVLRFEKAVRGKVEIRGPVFTLSESDPYVTNRRLIVKMDVQAAGLADNAVQVRVRADGHWCRAVTPRRTWDTTHRPLCQVGTMIIEGPRGRGCVGTAFIWGCKGAVCRPPGCVVAGRVLFGAGVSSAKGWPASEGHGNGACRHVCVRGADGHALWRLW